MLGDTILQCALSVPWEKNLSNFYFCEKHVDKNVSFMQIFVYSHCNIQQYGFEIFQE